MLEGEGIVVVTVKEPSWRLVVKGLVDVYTSIPGQAVRNLWMKAGFKWF